MTPRGFAAWSKDERDAARAKAAETRAKNKAERERKKAEREAKPNRRTAGISKSQVKNGIALIVVGVDAALAYGAPRMWVTPDDRLNEQEVELLTEAFSTEAMKSQRALRFLASLTEFSGRMGVVGALIVVALPRLMRRGMIPEAWVPVIKKLIGAATAKETEPEPEIPPREEPAPDRQAA